MSLDKPLISDAHITAWLTIHLVEALNNFLAGYPGQVDPVDVFMAVESLHRSAVYDIANRTGDPEWLWAALETFGVGMGFPVYHHGLDHAFDDVKAFHQAMGHKLPAQPDALNQEEIRERLGYFLEELVELEAAEELVEQVNELVDIVYLALGALANIGIRPGKIWQIVHESNMAKIPVPGEKPIKPDWWAGPAMDIAVEVGQQVAQAMIADWEPDDEEEENKSNE